MTPTEVTIRMAGPDDVYAVADLAALDSALAFAGPTLVAEVGDEVWAALSVADEHVAADPFRPSGQLVALLRERARQLREPGRTRRRRGAHRLAGVRLPARPSTSEP